jgi:Ser/Thr protein kinase RdoA (MazF antagonist)
VWRVCHCTSERRSLLLKSLVQTVGGVLQRWHARDLVYSDLHAGNVLVRNDMRVFLCDLETLASSVLIVDGVPTVQMMLLVRDRCAARVPIAST